MPLSVLVCAMAHMLPLCRNLTLICMGKPSSIGRPNAIVKAKFIGKQSTQGWCHFSTAITLRNRYLLQNVKDVFIARLRTNLRYLYFPFHATFLIKQRAYKIHC